MKSISDPFLRRPVLTLVLSLLVLLGGLISLPGLKVENLPPIAPGRVSVSASYPGASPEVVEQGVTTLLEKQFNGLERLDSIRSTSSANGSSISLGFEGGNPEINQINTQNEAAVVSRQLPAQVARFGVQVRRTSDDLLMVLSFSASRDRYDDTFLSGWVDQVIRDRLQRVPGVGEVRLFGGSSLAFRLWLDPLRLEERNLTISEVRDALEEQNVLAALGQAGVAPSPDDQLVTLPLRMEGRLRTAQEFESLVVDRSANGGVTLLKDVGRVSLGSENYESIATDLAGKTAVAVGIFQRDGSNALEVSQGIDQALQELGPRFPPGVDLQVIVDEAASIRTSIDRTTASLREAVLLVFLVLLLGLGNSRLALISASAVPVALIGSLAVLRLSGDSINTLTLFGMVLASGLVVDDAIVVSEDIGRRLENGRPPLEAAREAMAELGGAVIATSLVLIVVFLPVLTLGGSLGRLYAPIALTIGGTIVFSTFNALTFTPVAASRLLHADRREPAWLLRWIDPPRRALERLERPYDRLLSRVLGWRRRVVAGLLVGLLLTGLAFEQRPKAFIPQEDSGQLRGVVLLQDGIALPRTQQVMEQVREVMDQEPLIRFANFYAGRSFGDSSPNKGIFFLRLKPIEERPGADQSAAAVAERLNRRLRQRISDATVIVSESPTVRGFSSESGLEFDLLDTSGGRLSLGEFQQEAEAFIAAARQTGAFEQVGTRFSADAPLLRLIPDRLRMASLQVDLDELVSVLGASFGSDYVNDSFEGDQVRKVIVQLEGEARRDADDVLALQVRNRTGQLIPLAQIVQVEAGTGPTTINHTRLVRSISIRAQPGPGVSSGQAIALLEQLQSDRASTATDLEWAGLAREEARAGGGNLQVFALAVLVMLLVLAGLYENFADPFIILATVPMGVLGGVLGLALRGLPLDVYGQMGLLVLVALAAKNAILIVEFANQRLAEGMPLDEAVHGAAVARLRPILLTAFSSLAGFLPLLFATGAGSASRISIGTVVFFGLLVATVLTLFLVPTLYRIVKGWELSLGGGHGRRAEQA
ncbi:cation/multidrug efflux pump [Cyanobium sp. Copco_Reservoir_LC18]|uniref:efflux RND transporter permease subunit n=1 Tax=Cyanobium sp. Copco_Reservoir_LC18 TaxID=1328305 RepID=UPI00135C05DE|nr:efflux RND transporter permease subunit [Cyanobium sp. Copco_Reservoir_LC18]KAF0652613.1 cation/multidrug efflux pump [Cyanobium sp. Copco_Reservoir_LC18]